MRILFTTLLVSLCILFTNAQQPNAGKLETQPWTKGFLDKITVGGFYRLYYLDRSHKIPYGKFAKQRLVSVIDPTYFEPLLFLYVGGVLGTNSSFGAEWRLDQSMLGPSKISVGTISLYNSLVLRANTKTKKSGDYAFRFGGIEWLNFTPFSFGQNIAYNRFSIFERKPWDPGGNVNTRSASYYHTGNISQDIRFGTQAFKGLVTDISNLPYGLSASLLYGFSANYNTLNKLVSSAPKKVYAAKLVKKLDNLGEVGISTYNALSFEDSVKREFSTKKTFNMFEVFSTLKFKKKMTVQSELGYGVNKEPNFNSTSGYAFMLDIETAKEFTKIPLKFRAYRFGKYFINNDSYIGNTTKTPYTQSLEAKNPGAVLPVGARLTTPGDLVNNRVGLGLGGDLKIQNLKITTGIDVSQDIERFTDVNTLSYTHRINGLEISRFIQFPNAFGLFGNNKRMGTIYRGAYEVANISDSTLEGGLTSKLNYSSVDVHLKYKLSLFKRDLYFFNLNTISSVGKAVTVIPDLSANSFIKAQYHEFELYYNIWRDITLSGYYGIEIVKGNLKTDIDKVSGRARNQKGESIGIGLDYQINNDTFLYLRQKFYSFADASFLSEKFDGQITTIELKVFF